MALKLPFASPCNIYSIMKSLILYPIKSSFHYIGKVLPEMPQVMIDIHSRRRTSYPTTFLHVRSGRKVVSVIDGSKRRILEKLMTWRAANLGPGEVLRSSSLRKSSSQDHEDSDLEVPRTKPDPVQTGCSDERFRIACSTNLMKSLYQRHGGRPVILLHVQAISQSMIKRRGAQKVKKWEAMNEVYLARRHEVSSFARSEGHSNSVPHTRSTHVPDLKPIVMGEEITKHSFVPYLPVLVARLVEADDSSA